MARALSTFVALAAAFALGTMLFGWLAVPGLAMGWGWFTRQEVRGAVTITGAAVLAWIGLLVWGGLTGPIVLLAHRAAGVLGVPGWGLLVATPVFAGLLALSASALVRRLSLPP